MRRGSIRCEEVELYLLEEWNFSKEADGEGKWLTIRAFQLKLKDRGLLTTWPTLALRFEELYSEGRVEKINTSNGMCWKPIIQ